MERFWSNSQIVSFLCFNVKDYLHI